MTKAKKKQILKLKSDWKFSFKNLEQAHMEKR